MECSQKKTIAYLPRSARFTNHKNDKDRELGAHRKSIIYAWTEFRLQLQGKKSVSLIPNRFTHLLQMRKGTQCIEYRCSLVYFPYFKNLLSWKSTYLSEPFIFCFDIKVIYIISHHFCSICLFCFYLSIECSDKKHFSYSNSGFVAEMYNRLHNATHPERWLACGPTVFSIWNSKWKILPWKLKWNVSQIWIHPYDDLRITWNVWVVNRSKPHTNIFRAEYFFVMPVKYL